MHVTLGMRMRILSLSPSSTEILFALGAADDIVGVTHVCDYPEAAKYKPQFGSWLHNDVDRLMAVQPDAIVTTTFLPLELETLRATNQLLHLQPHGLAGVFETIHQLGDLTGRTEAARELVHAMQRSFEQIRAAAPTRRLSVYCEEWPHPPMIAGNWVPEIVELAGGNPVGGVHVNPSTPVDVDALHAANPDVMLFHWCSMEDPGELDSIRQRKGWDAFRAVHGNALVRIPNSVLNRPGPRLVEGARHVQQALLRYQHMH